MSVTAGGHFWAQIKNTKHCHVQGFLCNVKFIGLHKNVQALFGLLKDKLKCLLHLFKKKKTWTRRDQKRKKSQPYSHPLHMKILVSVRSLMINLSFCLQKMKPFMVKKKVTSESLHAGISALALLHFQFSVKNQIHGLFQVQNEHRWQKACVQHFSCDAAWGRIWMTKSRWEGKVPGVPF